MDTVVADGFYSVEDICTADYAEGVRGRRHRVTTTR